ncbi:hypothetical protein SAMN04488552_2178 [Christiangramia echinicola]|uniref:2TM domain-containing protein n=1 Tax=Christiangramia echinicola TaxID=279359 RepID=A0A1H1PP47_9FLAO|nr:hypothetical protein SAMN04488552_2178 [Christiangramia echinicola]
MKDIRVAYGIAALNIILLIVIVWHAYPNEFDLGFWLQFTSNTLILISMITSIRHIRNQKCES